MSWTDRKKQEVRYVHQLPYPIRRTVCQILDIGGEWRTLAGALDFTVDQIQLLEFEIQRPGGSPADAVLTRYGHSNATVRDLFKILQSIGSIRASSHLREFLPADSNSDTKVYKTQKSASENDCAEYGELPTPPLPLPRNPHMKTTACESQDYRHSLDQNTYRSGKENLDPVGSADGNSWSSSSGEPSQLLPKPLTVPGRVQGAEPGHLPPPRVPIQQSTRDPPRPPVSPSTNTSPESLTDQEIALRCCHSFTYDEIKKSCYNFHSKQLLGHGGFGDVYLGELKATQVAIKIMKPRDNLECDDNNALPRYLFAEIQSLLRYRHDNIISMFGYSSDGPVLCLVYQYMANGSLEDHLACKGGRPPLSWSMRTHILLGAARGITYLHTATDTPLIHGDIKSPNILLDKHFDAKVSDFGLAKQATAGSGSKYTHRSRTDASSKVYGSIAYLPSEFFRAYAYSTKTDVFSFGVVVYESCTGDRALDTRREGGEKLFEYVANIMASGNKDKLLQIRDPHTRSWPHNLWHELIAIGDKCTKPKMERPNMTEVLASLNKHHACVIAAVRQERQSPAPVTSMPSDGSYCMALEGQGKGFSAKEGTPHPDEHRIGIDLQRMALDNLKRRPSGEDPMYASDPEKLRLIEEQDQRSTFPKTLSSSDTVKPKELQSDPNKLKQLEEFDRQQSYHSTSKSQQDESVPYVLQQYYDTHPTPRPCIPASQNAPFDLDAPVPLTCSTSHDQPTAVIPDYVNFQRPPAVPRPTPGKQNHYINVGDSHKYPLPSDGKRSSGEHLYANVAVHQDGASIAGQSLFDKQVQPLPPVPEQPPIHRDPSSTVTECIDNMHNVQFEQHLTHDAYSLQVNPATADIIKRKQGKEVPDFIQDVVDNC